MHVPWGRIMLLMLGLYVFFIFLAMIYANKAMFPRPQTSYEKSDLINFLRTSSGSKIAFTRRGEIQNPKITILYSHGNGEDLGCMEPFFSKWQDQDWEIIAYDYPGYGLSSGKPSEQGCLEAIDTVYQFLIDQLGRTPEKIVVWGRSLGTGPSCHLAANKKIAGLLLETPFLSAFRTVTEIPILPWDPFDNLEKSKNIRSPSLIIHGKRDEIVPFRHGKRLHREFPQPKAFLELESASHNDLELEGGERYLRAIQEFIENLASS